MIWKIKRLNSSTAKERSSNSRIKLLASKMSSTTSRAWRKNTEMRTRISKKELIQNRPGTWNWQPPSRTLRAKFGLRRTRSCTWERNLRVPGTATQPCWTTILIFRLRLTPWTIISEWSHTRMMSWQRNLTSSCRPTKQLDRGLTARLEFMKSEQGMTSSWPPPMDTLSSRSPPWERLFRPTTNGIEQVIS